MEDGGNLVAVASDAGGRIIVSPDTNAEVIEAAAQANLVSTPGYFTPSEAFTAIRAGAHGLKFFPAEAATPAVVKAQRAVIPRHVPLLVVGGITPDSLQPWMAAGADGFGLGGGLYKPGQSASETAASAVGTDGVGRLEDGREGPRPRPAHHVRAEVAPRRAPRVAARLDVSWNGRGRPWASSAMASPSSTIWRNSALAASCSPARRTWRPSTSTT